MTHQVADVNVSFTADMAATAIISNRKTCARTHAFQVSISIKLTRVINWKSVWEPQLVTFGNHFRSQSIRCDYVMDLIAGWSAGFNERTIEINI